MHRFGAKETLRVGRKTNMKAALGHKLFLCARMFVAPRSPRPGAHGPKARKNGGCMEILTRRRMREQRLPPWR